MGIKGKLEVNLSLGNMVYSSLGLVILFLSPFSAIPTNLSSFSVHILAFCWSQMIEEKGIQGAPAVVSRHKSNFLD